MDSPLPFLALAACALSYARSACRERTPERSYIMIKPDGVQRGRVGEVISRFTRKGYKLVALKLKQATKADMESHYWDLRAKPFFHQLVSYMTSGPVCCMVFEGKDVVLGGRRLLGATRPSDSSTGTLRGDFAVDVGRNITHGSDSRESAEREIEAWFPEGLVHWTPAAEKWIYE